MSLGYVEENEASPLPFGQLCRRFSLSEIQSATHNFNQALIIGRGGFGSVYKGLFVNENSTPTAIKRLNPNSNQGAHEFWTEIAMLSKFRHCNLVSLIGYCNDNGEMALVYEYMPCGTLYDHLHKMPTRLSWIQRLKVCIGAARGLDYLHTGTSTQHRIIHRDVKSSNILLDVNLQAKVSDFGLSKVGPADQACSFVNTDVKGSFGYLDPEYFLLGRLTRKSDVYSFGVVLFEVLCGRCAVDTRLPEEQHNLAKWVQNRIEQGSLGKIIDPSMQGNILPGCLKEFANIAEQCLHKRSKKRPTMAEVVARLESALALQEGTDSLTDEEMYNDSGDSDSQEYVDYSLRDGEDSNDAEDNDNQEYIFYSFTEGDPSNDAVDNDHQENVESSKEHEITGISGHQEEWILGAAEGEQSYIKSADHKVASSGDSDDEHLHNTQTSFINGELVVEAMNCENEKNIGFVSEERVLDADAPYVSGSGNGGGSSRGGGHQDIQTLSEASGGQSSTTHTTKMNFTGKLKKLFFASSAPSGSSEENSGDVQEVPLARHLLPRDLFIFSFNELGKATENFNKENFLGQDEFGWIYKGWVHKKTYSPPSTHEVGMAVAIKRLYPGKVKSLKLLVERLAQYNHANFVKLLGYCLEDKKFLLVYEFMEKGNLASHLSESAELLPWFTRVKILLGAAEGLAFLHTTMEISSNGQFEMHNILLDGAFNSKLPYLGLELKKRKFPAIRSSTLEDFCYHYPYAPPETWRGEYDMKSDVFVFGVVLLEALTGLPKNSPDWKWRKRTLAVCLALLEFPSAIMVDELDKAYNKNMVDPRLENNYPREGAVLLGKLAQKCLEDIPKDRPSMEQVLIDLRRVYQA